MISETAIRPALVLLRALDDLDRTKRDRSSALRGPARRRAWSARQAMPPGALDRASASAIAARWSSHFEADFPAPEATAPPPSAIGTTYWLSSGDADGAVLRVRLERLPPRTPPFSSFWPGEVDEGGAAADAAEQVMRRLARLAKFSPSEPLRGWHRVVPAEKEAHAWRDLRIEGRSFGAALALMLASLWLGAPIDPSIAVTGDLDDRLRLTLPAGSVPSIEAKLRAVVRERACIQRVIVPRGLAPSSPPPNVRVIEADTFADVAAHFDLPIARLAPSPFSIQAWLGAVEEAEWLIRMRAVEIPIMRARLEALELALGDVWPSADRPAAALGALLRLLGRLCGFAAHDVDLAAALDVHRRIDDLVTTSRSVGRSLPLATLATVRNAQASAMIDATRYVSARVYAREALDAARAVRDEVEAARVLGTIGRIEAHARRDVEALEKLDEALVAIGSSVPWEANIARCYRVATLGRLGRFDAARSALDEARAINAAAHAVSEGWRADNELYLDYEGLKLALATGDVEGSLAALEGCERRASSARGVWPGLGVLVRGVEACLLAQDRAGAEARFARLLAKVGPDLDRFRALVGRAAAQFVVFGVADDAHRTHVRAWIAHIPDGEDSPLRGPRDLCRMALVAGIDPAPALRDLLSKEID